MNFINAATKKERTHVEEIIKSQPVMPHEGITATEIGICGKQNLFMDVYRPDNDAEKLPIIIDIHGGGLIAGRKEQNQNLATWLAKEGYLTFVPDYRLVPETNIFGQITDVINAFATVAERAEDFVGDLNQVFVVADSAGAFLACMASALHPNLKTLWSSWKTLSFLATNRSLRWLRAAWKLWGFQSRRVITTRTTSPPLMCQSSLSASITSF